MPQALNYPTQYKMSLHLNSDAVALIALIISLVALLIALLQVVQQYAATAYDYRRCSARTMGGWSKYTKRVFVPTEIRFEITFAVPHIELEFFPGKYLTAAPPRDLIDLLLSIFHSSVDKLI